jgi:hypothetical protein
MTAMSLLPNSVACLVHSTFFCKDLLPKLKNCSVERKKRNTTQAAKHSLHELRKKRHIGPKCHESPPPKEKRKLVGIRMVAGSPLLQTETLRAIRFSSARRVVCLWHHQNHSLTQCIPRDGQSRIYTPHMTL